MITAFGRSETPSQVGSVELVKGDLVAPGLAQEIREHLDRQLLTRTAPIAEAERRERAFYTTKPGGLGMGLSICRSIIEAHRGRLWATANVPQGAVFQFTVPAHPDSAP